VEATQLTFSLPDGSTRTVEVRHAFNAGYAGRDTAAVQHHIAELAQLGVPVPGRTPTLYPLPVRLVVQTDEIQVPHGRTSGEAEWALVVGSGPDDLLLTAACDHTDRDLEVHGVAWSKQCAPDLLGDLAFPLDAGATGPHGIDHFTLTAWVGTNAADGSTGLIQDGLVGQLLPPSYWLDQLGAAGLLQPGTVILGGTIPMLGGVDQFADRWRVELADGQGNVSRVDYAVDVLPASWE
jgi:Protein of unknown function (DUF2848)